MDLNVNSISLGYWIKIIGNFNSTFYAIRLSAKFISYTVFVCSHPYHFIVFENRIFVSCNTIFDIVYDIFVSVYREVLLSIYKMFGSSADRTIFKALYFKSASSQSWCSRHWMRLPQMERTRDRAKPPMKRRTYFDVGSKRWVTSFF